MSTPLTPGAGRKAVLNSIEHHIHGAIALLAKAIERAEPVNHDLEQELTSIQLRLCRLGPVIYEMSQGDGENAEGPAEAGPSRAESHSASH